MLEKRKKQSMAPMPTSPRKSAKSPSALYSSVAGRQMYPSEESSLGVELDRLSYVPTTRDTMSRISEVIDYSSSQDCSDSEDDLPTLKSRLNHQRSME